MNKILDQIRRVILITFVSIQIPAAAEVNSGSKPNIILFMAEDIGNDLACYGHKGVKTPTLDRLAAEGLLYKRFYTNSPICSPSRTSLMMGMYQTSSGGHHHRSSVQRGDLHYMTHYLRQAGYLCINGSPLIKRKSGKTDVNIKTKGKLFDKAKDRKPGQPFFHQIQLQVTHRQAGDSRWQNLRNSKKNPVKISEVEIPPYLPDTAEVRLDWATYLDQIEQADLETKTVIDDLRERGELENTVIIWIGDNGRCQIRGKGYLYEDGIKCPLIIWGRGIGKGKVIEDLVEGVDLTATILAIAGIEKPKQMQGQAFLFNQNYQANDYVYSARDRWDEVVDCSRVVIGKRYKYIRNFMPEVPYDANQAYLNKKNVRPILAHLRDLNNQGELTPEQAYFFEPQKEREQLFDLQEDPFELKNLQASAQHQDVKKRLKKELFDWIESSNDQGLVKDKNGKWSPKPEKREKK